ncbi:MAG: RsmB/NOP family class I SAM-dependent RNA methyltransferase [Promethearchaeota archaeon]|nr:MAG: RsmB/NOP family class I SAM-dependent RNA methyltransferase [Candidatus Lokiarchaeota archaeon]
MKKPEKLSINKVIYLLDQFIEGEIVNLDRINRQDPGTFHYYTEIVRYWSKLNYVFQKTLRAVKLVDLPEKERAKFIYIIYRILEENASINNIKEELDLSKIQEFKISHFINKLISFSWKRALNGKAYREKLSIKEAIPTFFIDRLLPYTSIDFLKENVRSMNRYHTYKNFLRISNLRKSFSANAIFKDLKQELKTYHIALKQDQEIPELIDTPYDIKSKVLETKSYKSGNLVFQDKGSVAVVKVLSPQKYESICDMCAAPGNKTNLIAQDTFNQARIIAGEFLSNRVYEMAKRIDPDSFRNIHLINTDSIQFPSRFENYFDRVLLDAPCTGSGTFVTNPELKWRQNWDFLYQNITLQEKLIRSALRLLKPNGIFVYSTCSLYPEEGELQILKFLEQLEPLKLPAWFSPSYKINDQVIAGTGRLFPALHHTHGFFIGKFKKKEA